nr:RNA-directed DNA polymerase, eukaryota [Tanacetum cinerariifolium]
MIMALLVDVFIPNKKSKVGKRFAFVRFIKVINLDRLIENLNTIWISRFHLFANPVRFERPKKPNLSSHNNAAAASSYPRGIDQAKGKFQTGSYVNVVNGSFLVGVHGPSISSASVLVLDDSCVAERDLSNHIMGKVKDVSFISNLRTLIMEEGFFVVNLVYLGGLWVMIECDNVETKANMKKWGEALDIEDNVDSSFGRKRLCIKTKLPLSILESFKEMEYTSDEDSDVGPQKVPDRSEAVGNSGGILCVWEATVFKKDYATISDNFVSIYGTWLPSNSKVLFEAIYAPQQVSRKRLLWDYVLTLIDRWNAEVVVLENFNEVWNIDERRWSCFNPISTRVFDQFISASGLVDVKMEGYTFTWSHPSGSKMSKLDRFFVSEGGFWSDPISVLSVLD